MRDRRMLLERYRPYQDIDQVMSKGQGKMEMRGLERTCSAMQRLNNYTVSVVTRPIPYSYGNTQMRTGTGGTSRETNKTDRIGMAHEQAHG
jgi:hypothetical protein